MADIDLKTATPDTSLPTTGFLFGADSQAASVPSVYSAQTVATTLLGPTTPFNASITADAPVLNLAQTWNASGVTFTGLRFNAAGTSDANSAAASLLMDLQVGGSSKFKISKDGGVVVPSAVAIKSDGANAAKLTLTDGFGAGTGFNFSGYNQTAPFLNAYMETSGEWTLRLRSNASLSWTDNSGNAASGNRDLILTRRAAANLRLGAADTGATTSTVTITIAAPGVVTWGNHGFSTGTPVVFTTTGALPTGITAGTTYYAVVVDANTFQIASSVANAIAAVPTVITTSGTQSGTHTGTRYNITQRLGMQSNTGVTDRLGADLIIQGSQGTGTGAGGSIVFQVAPAGAVSNGVQNALATALTIATATQSTSFRIAQTTGYAGGNTASLVFVSSVDAVLGGIISNGQSGEIRFGAFNNGGYYPTFYSNNVERWRIDANGHFLAGADNQYDIGASGATRPRSIYTSSGVVFANSLAVNSSTFNAILWNGGQFGWGSGATVNTSTNTDTGLKRSAAAIIAVTNGSTGGGAVELQEMTAPTAPATNNVRIYAEDNGSGKTRLMALFPTGAAVQIAIEP